MRNITKAMTLRLPEPLYEAGRKIARQRRVSLSQLVRECLQAALEEEDRRLLYDAFTEVGMADDEASVEFAVPAQAEVTANADA